MWIIPTEKKRTKKKKRKAVWAVSQLALIHTTHSCDILTVPCSEHAVMFFISIRAPPSFPHTVQVPGEFLNCLTHFCIVLKELLTFFSSCSASISMRGPSIQLLHQYSQSDTVVQSSQYGWKSFTILDSFLYFRKKKKHVKRLKKGTILLWTSSKQWEIYSFQEDASDCLLLGTQHRFQQRATSKVGQAAAHPG